MNGYTAAKELRETGTANLEMIAHDLRTPICCVSGAAQMALAASRQGKTVDEQLNQILAAVDAMNRMLEEMCNLQRDIPCTMDMLAHTVYTVMRPRAEKKAQRFTVDFTALQGIAADVDAAQIQRILLNLISNAMKYTQEGGVIEVTADREKSWIVFYVSDNGMGMKKDFLRRMYVPFERAKESEHLPGKGLGLAIVRRLLHKMGGKIAVKSTWGKGTTFAVKIPIQREQRLKIQ